MMTPQTYPERTHWTAVIALGAGIFTMTTLEELPIGVLTLMSDGLETSDGVIGLGVTVPGVLAAIVAIIAPRLTGRIDRRLVLTAALIASALSALMTALAPSPGFFLASRILIGIGLGVFWALLGASAARLASPRQVARALTVAFSGGAGAIVLGVPLATYVGALVGWRGSFFAAAALATSMAIVLWVVVPPIPATPGASFADIGRAWSLSGVRFGVLYTFVVVLFHFNAYTYASPILQKLSGVSVAGVGTMLLIFGLAGLSGNFLSGPAMDRSLTATMVALPLGLAIAMAVLTQASGPLGAGAVMALWGLFGGAVSVVSQGWVLDASGDLAEPASGLNSGAFNLGIAGGALTGGLIQPGIPGMPGVLGAGGPVAIVTVSIIGMIVALFLAVAAARRSRRVRAS
ncbi:MFS transporter [Corynebacterium sp. TAE3-ERU12]|uniref:MFS transporter n=1 Tax=Corynebacterium sp. TAE3-ERU12 TaxID=2849491 RepID=UPI001C46CE9A|nr:MFS transporter [Corynebacterium sp. TAE3-ERU12]MBV7294715.1 MFS transporter [Corynebacterium sp. TAE3-ERU12]